MSSINKLINNHWSNFNLEKKKQSSYDYSKDELVGYVLNILSEPKFPPKETTFAKEIRVISKITEIVSKSISDGSITEAQGEKLLKFMLSSLISKRVSKVFENIGTETNSYNWIVAASEKKFQKKDPKKPKHFSSFEFIDE